MSPVKRVPFERIGRDREHVPEYEWWPPDSEYPAPPTDESTGGVGGKTKTFFWVKPLQTDQKTMAALLDFI